MTDKEDRHFHDLMNFVGIRAPLTAAAVIQLVKELRRAGLLDEEALKRIKDAVKREAALARGPHLTEDEFATGLIKKLDEMMGD